MESFVSLIYSHASIHPLTSLSTMSRERNFVEHGFKHTALSMRLYFPCVWFQITILKWKHQKPMKVRKSLQKKVQILCGKWKRFLRHWIYHIFYDTNVLLAWPRNLSRISFLISWGAINIMTIFYWFSISDNSRVFVFPHTQYWIVLLSH